METFNHRVATVGKVIRNLGILICACILCTCSKKPIVGYNYVKPKKSIFVDYDYLEPDTMISYSLSLHNDTIDICLTNNGDSSLILLDSFLTDRELSNGVLEDDILYRYNPHKDVFKISFLPLLQYMTFRPFDVIVMGKWRVIRGFQVLYSYKAIEPAETVCYSVPFKVPREDTWMQDIDVRDYNIWDGRGRATVIRTKKIDKHIRESEVPDVRMELAVYCDTTGVNSNDFSFVNNKLKTFKVVNIPLPKDIIEMIFRD